MKFTQLLIFLFFLFAVAVAVVPATHHAPMVDVDAVAALDLHQMALEIAHRPPSWVPRSAMHVQCSAYNYRSVCVPVI